MSARALLLAVLAAWVTGAAADAHDRWLLGTWALADNPDGAEQDWLVFEPEGRARTRTASGRTLTGGYRLQGSRLHLYFDVGGRPVPLVMTYPPDRTRLYIRSERTGNTASYARSADPSQ